MLVDSHCHLDRLDLDPFGGDADAMIDYMVHSGVGHMLCVAIDLESYPQMLALAERHAPVSASVGVHPNEREGREPERDELVRLSRHPKVVAIGETGLDYFRSEGDLEWQRDRFRTHIAAARHAHKPLIIHSRDARSDTLRILREEQADEVGGVMHCFTEDWDMARAALDLNFLISFSGIVTFRSAHELRDVARRVPEDRMLVETDSPYLAPVPLRGKPNQPAYVQYVAQCVAELRGMSTEALAAATTRNFFSLFKDADRPANA